MENSGVGTNALIAIIAWLINVILVPVIWALWRAHSANQKALFQAGKDLDAHKLHVAKNYMTKDDLKGEFDSISKTLDGIWKEIKELRKNGGK